MQRRARRLAVRQLRDAHVGVSLARDLRQVRDAQHLRALAERSQLAADDLRDAAADAGIDFVEHQAGQRVGICAAATWIARLMRDSSPPDATFASGARRLAGIRADQELDLVGAVRAGASASSARTSISKLAAGHAERLHQRR